MGIYIKGMELPEDAERVIIVVDTKDEREAFIFPKLEGDIVNIHEPHGRLIDGDSLWDRIDRLVMPYKWEIKDRIDTAPTIIEGSEE